MEGGWIAAVVSVPPLAPAANRINLVDKDDAWLHLPCQGEDGFDNLYEGYAFSRYASSHQMRAEYTHLLSLPMPLAHESRWRDVDEDAPALARQRLCKVRLAVAGQAEEQDTLIGRPLPLSEYVQCVVMHTD